MITFALTPHKVAIQQANQICDEKGYDKIRLFVDLRNSIPVFFDEEKVKLLLKDLETAVISFVESTLKFMEYSIIQFNRPIEFNFFYEIGRSEYHRKLNKGYKANRHTSYLILSPDEIKQASDLNVKCFETIYETLQNVANTAVYRLQYFEADFIPHYISREYPEEKTLNIILSNDKDMFQSLTLNHDTILFKKDFRKKETRVITFDNMYQEISKSDITIESEHNFIADLLAVCGDEADGVQGIKGVGYVSALRLYSALKTPLEKILEIDDIDKIKELSEVEIKGRLNTTLKKILESKDLVEVNRKQVDYDIISKNIPFNTKKSIHDVHSNSAEGNFDKFFEDIKFIRTDFTTLLSALFPDKLDIINSQYLPYIENGIYQEYSVDRTVRNGNIQQAYTANHEPIKVKDNNIIGFLL